MSRRLLQLVIPVTPERRMFRVHDPSVDPDAPGGPLPPVGALISTNREQLWVGSLQEDIDVRLVLEEWDEAPPPCGDAWDEEAKGSIYLRGQLSISMGLAGTAVRGLRLAGGVGDYSVRVYAGNRDQVTRRYAQLFDRHRNPLSDEFQQEKKTLEGLERYLVQLWRESLTSIGPPPAAPRRPDGGLRASGGRRDLARRLSLGRLGLTGAGAGARRGRGRRGRSGTGCAGIRARRRERGIARLAVGTGGRGRGSRGRLGGRIVRAERDHRVDHQRDHRDEQDREQRADDARPGGAQDAGRPGAPECRQAGGQPRIVSREPPLDLGELTLLVRRQRHSATSTSCTGWVPSHYLSGPGLYPIVLPLYFPRFHADRPAVRRRARLNTSGESEGYTLAIIEQPFYRVRYALGQSAAR